jgi:hypothetical protein
LFESGTVVRQVICPQISVAQKIDEKAAKMQGKWHKTRFKQPLLKRNQSLSDYVLRQHMV